MRTITYLCSNVPRLIAVVTHFRPAARAACVTTLTCMYVRVSNAFYESAHDLSIWKTDKSLHLESTLVAVALEASALEI